MCIICVELEKDKLTIEEARRNLRRCGLLWTNMLKRLWLLSTKKKSKKCSKNILKSLTTLSIYDTFI